MSNVFINIAELHHKYNFIIKGNSSESILHDEERQLYNVMRISKANNSDDALKAYTKQMMTGILTKYMLVFKEVKTKPLADLVFTKGNEWSSFINMLKDVTLETFSYTGCILLSHALLFLLRTTRRAIFIYLTKSENTSTVNVDVLAENLRQVLLYLTVYIPLIPSLMSNCGESDESRIQRMKMLLQKVLGKDFNNDIKTRAENYLQMLMSDEYTSNQLTEIEDFTDKIGVITHIMDMNKVLRVGKEIKYVFYESGVKILSNDDTHTLISQPIESLKQMQKMMSNEIIRWEPLIANHTDIVNAAKALRNAIGNGYTTENLDDMSSLETFVSALQRIVTAHYDYIMSEACNGGTNVKCSELVTGKKQVDDIFNQVQMYIKDKTSKASVIARNIKEAMEQYVDNVDKIFDTRIILNFRTEGFNDIIETANAINNCSWAGGDNVKSIKFKSIKSLDTNNMYGPFYLVTCDGRDLDFSRDVISLLSRDNKSQAQHLIYSAYGYSGSGKSYTLLNNPQGNSVFQNILRDLLKYGTKNLQLQLVFYDLYGEIDDRKCDPKNLGVKLTEKPKIEKVTFFTIKNGHVQHTKANEVPNNYPIILSNREENTKESIVQNISGMYQTINDYRVKTNFADTDTAQEYHVRQTPNNPESSRSHFFIDIYVSENNSFRGKITIMDMGGSEDVQAIQDSYFYTVHDIPRLNIQNVKTISEKLKKPELITSLFEKDERFNELKHKKIQKSQLTNNYDIIGEAIVIAFNQLSPDIVYPEYQFVQPEFWYKLLRENERLQTYLDKNNPKSQPLLFSVVYNLLSILCAKFHFDAECQIVFQGFNDFMDGKFTQQSLSVSWANFYNDTKSHLLKSYEAFIVPYKELLNKKSVDKTTSEKSIEGIKKSITSSIFEKTFNVLVDAQNQFNKKIEDVAKECAKCLDKFSNDKELKTDNKVLKLLIDFVSQYSEKYVTQRASNSQEPWKNKMNETDVQEFEQLFELFNTVIDMCHCPIRRQGVYINNTLEDIKVFTNNVSKVTTTRPKTQVVDVLRRTLDANKFNIPISNTKFVLLTNVRLDFDINNRAETTLKKYIANSYDLSLSFAHSANPFKTSFQTKPKLSGGKKCIKKRTNK